MPSLTQYTEAQILAGWQYRPEWVAPTHITYHFATEPVSYNPNVAGFGVVAQSQRYFFTDAFYELERLTDLTFEEVSTQEAAWMVIAAGTSGSAAAFAYLPYNENPNNRAGDMYFRFYSNYVVMHEIAHTLGGVHPHDTLKEPANTDSTTFTLLSYNAGGHGSVYRPFDVVALTQIYGEGVDPASEVYSWTNVPLTGYLLQGQSEQWVSGSPIVDDDEITLQGNLWVTAKLSSDYVVSSKTWVSFEADIGDAGEIIGIAFGGDKLAAEKFGFGAFQLGGSQPYFTPIDGSNGVYNFHLGAYTRGLIDRVVFICDDDYDATAKVTFSNLRFHNNDEASPPPPSPPPPTVTVLAINCGGGAFTASDGMIFSADAHYSSGRVSTLYIAGRDIGGTPDDEVYQSVRYGSDLSYDIPVDNGTYDVTLRFVENYFCAANQRVFDVAVEGVERISNLDIFAEAGRGVAHDVTVGVQVTDGMLDIDFLTQSNLPSIAGILIESALI